MSTWLTESEFRQSGARATGVTINVAFLKEIKDDNIQLAEIMDESLQDFSDPIELNAKSTVDRLFEIRDALETHFALEEFYGYFQNALLTNPSLSPQAEQTQNEHQQLFLQLNEVVELAEQILYRECSPETTIRQVAIEFAKFHEAFLRHEHAENELMMRLCNEEIGVGD